MSTNAPKTECDQHPEMVRNLGWPKLITRLVISWERLWPLVLPLLLVVLGFLTVSWFGLWTAAPDFIRFGLVALFGVAIVAALLPLRHFRAPSKDEIEFRIERRSALLHRPLTMQSDNLAAGNDSAFSKALWKEQRTRTARQLNGLKSGAPQPALAEKDPFALRAIALLLAFVAFGFAAGDHFGPVKAAFSPPGSNNNERLQLAVWATPPSYTNRPPVFLKRMADASTALEMARVPEGSELVVRIIGQKELSLNFVSGSESTALEPISDAGADQEMATASEYHFKLQKSGKVKLASRDKLLGQWSFDIIADDNPRIRFDEKPKRGAGRMLDLAFSVEDDYGVTRAVAEIRPVNSDPEARPLVKAPDISLPVPRRHAKKSKVKLSRDLSRHPLAGGEVTIALIATDGAGQKGKSRVERTVLPARLFTEPLAAALVEQRRNLAMDARNASSVANMLDIFANTAPEEFIDNASVYLGLHVAWRAIGSARNDDDLRDVLEMLWTIAQAIEDGDLSATAARLREAQEALKRALENGASDKEIDRLMKELRQAMSDHLNELAKQMARNQNDQSMPQNQDTQTLRKQDLERMMDRIENLAKSGSKEAAKQLLSELQQMMDQLQAGRHQRQRQQEGDQFNQQMNNLSKMMQKQQRLMDETFRMQQQKPRRGKGDRQQERNQSGQRQQQQRQQGNKNGKEQAQNAPMTPEEYANAMKQLQQEQGQLRDQLQKMMKDLKDQGVDPGKELGKAGKAMSKARDALGKSRNAEAMGEQGKALNAMRRGAQDLMKQMQENMAGERGGTDANGRQRNDKAKNDPLGRQQRSRGANYGNIVKVPDEIDAQKAREILEAIRRKLANPGLPKMEFNYLDRLLKPQ